MDCTLFHLSEVWVWITLYFICLSFSFGLHALSFVRGLGLDYTLFHLSEVWVWITRSFICPGIKFGLDSHIFSLHFNSFLQYFQKYSTTQKLSFNLLTLSLYGWNGHEQNTSAKKLLILISF